MDARERSGRRHVDPARRARLRVNARATCACKLKRLRACCGVSATRSLALLEGGPRRRALHVVLGERRCGSWLPVSHVPAPPPSSARARLPQQQVPHRTRGSISAKAMLRSGAAMGLCSYDIARWRGDDAALVLITVTRGQSAARRRAAPRAPLVLVLFPRVPMATRRNGAQPAPRTRLLSCPPFSWSCVLECALCSSVQCEHKRGIGPSRVQWAGSGTCARTRT